MNLLTQYAKRLRFVKENGARACLGAPLVQLRFGLLLALVPIGSGCAAVLGIDDPQPRSGNGSGGAAGESSQSGSGGRLPINAGAPSEGGSISGSSGAGSASDVSPQAGSAGDPSPQAGASGNDLEIAGPASPTLCPGTPISMELEVTGGHGPYVWAADDPALELVTAGDDDARATLSGTAAITARVTVQDVDGQSAWRTVPVAGVPIIAPPAAMPSVCPHEVYNLKLNATGGNASHYRWKSDDLPPGSGLEVTADGVLQGTFSGVPSGPTNLSFHVQLQDDGQCASDPITLTLPVRSQAASECPRISFDGQLSPATAPALCVGGAYDQKLIVSGGTEPYVWNSSVHPAALSVAETGSISGTYRSDAQTLAPVEPLTVTVTDGRGKQVEAKYQVKTRQSCWFAYIAKSTSDAKLNFFDPELGNRRGAPAAALGDMVTDFKFSPNGRYIAYRVTTAGASTELSLIDVGSWREQRFPFVGVTRYSWSPNSETLAVAYQRDSNTVLGGVNVARALTNGAGISFPTLAEISASPVSDSVWFGDGAQQLAYIANEGGLPQLEAVTLMASAGQTSGFGLRVDDASVPLIGNVRLRGSSGGVFAIPRTFSIVHYANDGASLLATLHSGVVVAPSGRFVAKAAGGALKVFRPIEDSAGPATLQQPGCDSVLSWASETERVACTAVVGSDPQQLNFIDISSAMDNSPDALALTSTVAVQVPPTQRRLFSPAGDFFAFTTSGSSVIFRLVDKAAFTMQSEGGGLPAELLFSSEHPAGSGPARSRFLLEHRGPRLTLFDLTDQSIPGIRLEGDLADSIGCVEDFQDTKVGWCGAERTAAPYLFSSDAEFVAFQLLTGTLKIIATRTGLISKVNDQCGLDCVVAGQFKFQP